MDCVLGKMADDRVYTEEEVSLLAIYSIMRYVFVRIFCYFWKVPAQDRWNVWRARQPANPPTDDHHQKRE